jgi:hypothetical protein
MIYKAFVWNKQKKNPRIKPEKLMCCLEHSKLKSLPAMCLFEHQQLCQSKIMLK